MKKILLLMAVALPLAFISCNSAQDSESQITVVNSERAKELTEKHLDALALDSADRLCVDKVNEFAFFLLHHIAKDQDSSFVVAPLSLASGFAMVGNGADGLVRDSLEQMFGPIINANAFYKKYMAALPHNDYTDCQMLNYLAVNTSVPIMDAFSKTVTDSYNACAKNHGFADKKVVKQINDWFHQQSLDDKIRVVEKLDKRWSLCLINALEFNALWPPFDEENTHLQAFETAWGEYLKIPIMHNREGHLPYVDREGFQAVSMPYYGSCYRMLVVLPKSEKLATFSQSMTLESFNQILDSLTEPVDVILELPRFKCESALSMMDMLKEFLPSVFGNESFGFNAIIDDPFNSLVITEVDQKTSIEVNEKGTRAFSVTKENYILLSLTPEFIANHPFLYFVYDEATRAILLMGQFCGDGAIF
jgi:serpin B